MLPRNFWNGIYVFLPAVSLRNGWKACKEYSVSIIESISNRVLFSLDYFYLVKEKIKMYILDDFEWEDNNTLQLHIRIYTILKYP